MPPMKAAARVTVQIAPAAFRRTWATASVWRLSSRPDRTRRSAMPARASYSAVCFAKRSCRLSVIGSVLLPGLSRECG